MNLADKRITITRVFSVILIPLILFTTHSWRPDGAIEFAFKFSGLILVIIGSYGRIWSYLYICGKKTKILVTSGPYSITRNPLYLFSFIGAAGIGLASENIAIMALVVIAFLVVYPFVIRAEEYKLEAAHGEKFREYAKSVPRFIPRSISIEEPTSYHISPKKFRYVFFDAMWFVWLYLILLFIEKLQENAFLPILWKIP
ncbi:MAG: isoprenylcysteine carboxylmethyltransferase family protein [Desulfovibrionales bacterium]